ncbi:hypothetical protein [Thermophilibacter mediterraneus]|uniref:hypothetical protein n=1 Tax=Thermophilibacter mediterraneus TaxID=1871031 RepID=UPI000931918E|nr:hypothetical protein [Thermophilibacter mediterraneus]
MRKRLFATLMLAAGMLFAAPATALADGITMSGEVTGGTVTVDNTSNTITVSGDATMNGTGNAFTINANTTLEFGPGATLALTGYDNAFVVSGATLSGGGWNITDGDGMDLFRLQSGGKLSIDDDVTLTGNGTDAATDTIAASRAIVLESGSGQEVALADGQTLTANGFYRGMETGGASGYTISGQNSETSIFDFSDNDCGMALSYFDSSATYKNCKLEVSDCLTSGIFMRQDNAALAGLTIDGVWINCVNDENLDQADIAIRFHSNDFTIKDSKINIQNAWNTGLWICDGWNANEKNEILDTEIIVNHVEDNQGILDMFGGINHRKGITFVPYRRWEISGCTISLTNTGEGGINIASDPQLNRNGSILPSSWTVTPGMHGGHVVLEDTRVTTSGILGADLGVQAGQWLEIGEGTVIDNGHASDHYTVLCDDLDQGYPVQVPLFGLQFVQYDTSGMSEENKSSDRIKVTGGSFWSTREEGVTYPGTDYSFFEQSIPVNADGENLVMVEVTPDQLPSLVSDDGRITVMKAGGGEYDYYLGFTSAEESCYLWIPDGATLQKPDVE